MKLRKFMTIILSIVTIFVVANLTYGRGWTEVDGEWYYLDESGEKVTDSIKTSEGFKVYLNQDGVMARDYILEDYNGGTYYFNDDGYMVANTWVAVDPSQVEDQDDYGPTIYLYYFGNTGRAYKATNGIIKKNIDGKKYLFDEKGRMLSGWINESGDMFNSQDADEDPFLDDYIYYGGDETDGELREGWFEYTDGSLSDDYYERESIWFYFNPTTNKKTRYDGSNGRNKSVEYTEKTINGKKYAFDENGVMLIEWEAEAATRYYAKNDAIAGQLMKKEWIFAVPSEEINQKDHDDETERWFYASSSGDITKSTIKKINTKDYAFADNGIMKTGLVVFDRVTHAYVATVDIEGTTGKDFITYRKYRNKDADTDNKTAYEDMIFNPSTQVIYYFENDEFNQFFGAKKIKNVNLAFGDKDYTFYSEKSGEREGYKSKDKAYYQMGLKLVPDSLIGYGLVLDSFASPSTIAQPTVGKSQKVVTETKDVEYFATAVSEVTEEAKNYYNVYYDDNHYNSGDYSNTCWMPLYRVVDGAGKKILKANVYRKDNNGNYWIIGDQGQFVKVVSVPVKYSKSTGWQFRSEVTSGTKTKTEFINFGTLDYYNKTVLFAKQPEGYSVPGYDVRLDETYALNFVWKD